MTNSSIYILHGWTSDSETEAKWQPLVDLLEQAGFVCNFLAIPGLDRPIKQAWRLADYRRWLKKELGTDKPVFLIGHSFGGQVAASFTANFNQQVKKLILIDSAGIKINTLSMRLKRAVFGAAAKLGKALVSNQFLKKKLRWLLYKLAREKDYYQSSPVMRKTMTNVLQEQIHRDLEKINTPTLIIWGGEDLTTPYQLASEFQELITNSKLYLVRSARHSPQYSHPEQVAAAVVDFLNSDTD